MAVSAPTTPAHASRPLNLPSESSAWLDEVTSASTLQVDILNGNQNAGFDANSNSVVDDLIELEKNGLDRLELTADAAQMIEAPPANLVQYLDKEQQIRAEYLNEIESLQEKVSALASERSRFIREISDLTSTLEKTRTELNSVESELEQHRARAIRTLQERDKLISELRNSSGTESDDSSFLVELNQLRQERETLREENRQVREKLRIARQESIEADLNAEKLRQKAMEASIQARESIANERRRRMDAEEDAKLKSDEVRSLREELNIRQTTLTTKLQNHESEFSRLQSQLSAAATPNSEVEKRLSTLTRTLVLKQQELEHLTTDRNALRLQLEKLEHEYQNWRKSLPFNSLNDTDDAKALLPSFLMESPFDTGVTRRVKRAHSTLDAVSIKIGVFFETISVSKNFCTHLHGFTTILGHYSTVFTVP